MNIIEKLGISKAPWSVAKENERSGLYILGSDVNDQVVTGGYNKFNPLGVNEMVDAQLIATAPEMLEALIEDAYNFDLNNRDGMDLVRKEIIEVYNKRVYIIEKATGRSWEEIKEIRNEQKSI